LSGAEAFNVGVLSTAFGGPYFGELMAGMATELAFTGGKLIAIQTVDAGTVEKDFPERPPFPHHVGWDYVGGFVVFLNGVSIDYLRAARGSGRPVVVISDVPPGFDCPIVLPDNSSGSRAATQHLIDHGHTRIGYVGFPGQADVKERLQAYRETMADNGLTPQADLLFAVDDMQEPSGERAAHMMLERGMPATAVLTGNDRNAVGLIRALTNAGLDLPNDLAVIGFDDTEEGAHLTPSLTSVRQPLEDIGALAVRLLVKMRIGEEVATGNHVIPTSLTIRESCGCAGLLRIAPKAVEADVAGNGLDVASSLPTLLETWHARSRYLNYPIDFGAPAARIDDVLTSALAGTSGLVGLVLRRSLAPLAEILEDNESFAEVVRLIRQRARQIQADAGRDQDLDATRRMEECLQEIFLLLAQGQTTRLSTHAKSMMSSLGKQYSISLQLLRSQEKDPRSLDWLQVTDVRAGCLGLWPEREPNSGKRVSLNIVGRFDREKGSAGGANDVVRLTAFPPAELVSLADIATDHMVYIAHLKVGPGDWGMLAVVTPIQAYIPEGRETMNQWAALLSVALEHEALLKTMREQEEHLRRAALYDELTGLPNRAYFRTRLTSAIARANRRSDYKYAVLMLDLDGFKIVNDSLGHPAGDLLLQQVATRLITTLRSLDTAARFGGDEFAILLEEIAEDNSAVTLAERLQRELSQPHRLGDTEVVVSASIGITIGNSEYNDTETIMRDADVAMYHAKSHGKRSHAIFDPAMHSAAAERLTIENDLRKALSNQELVLFYQPIVELRTLTVSGAEALIRWRHPTRGLVPPNEFLTVAEESGLSLGIGTWVLGESCRQMRQWGLHHRDARPFMMSVNVSNRQFWQSGLIDDVDDNLRTYGLSPDRLAVEITEGVIMDDVKVASSMLSGLRTLGVQVHIDDFGTGYSSLEALHDLAIDAFKIDRSFISRIATSPRSKELVRTIVTMGLNLELDVVAEGIETNVELEFVRKLGCSHGQGYLFSRPMPAEEFKKLMERAGDVIPV
jgi:diguanylate cyclase (GGDEF)-like protein